MTLENAAKRTEEAEKQLREHCHIPARASQKLADMTPEELWSEAAKNPRPSSHAIHALIQRATREAREGMCPESEFIAKHNAWCYEKQEASKARKERNDALDVLRRTESHAAALHKQLTAARALCDELQGRLDTLTWDAQVAERNLASVDAAIEGAYAEMCNGLFSVPELQGARCLASRIRDRLNPPSPREAVPSVEPTEGRSAASLSDVGGSARAGAESATPVAYGLEDDFGNIHVARAGRHPAEDAQRELAALGIATKLVPLCRVALATGGE